jgi:hypothetical protein
MHKDAITDRKRLLCCTLISSLLLLFTILLPWGCRPRKQPIAGGSTIIYADTTRIKLVHRVDTSGKALTIIQQRSNSTVTPYGKSVQQFDSIQLTLP